MMRTSPCPSRHQHGLTLMEVLVSMLVMALGLLGMAALQTSTLKYQLGTAERTNLGFLLSDYAERVRANIGQAPGVVEDSKYLLAYPSTSSATTTATTTATTGGAAAPAQSAEVRDCSGSAGCSGAERAAFDMEQWQASVRDKLPQGVAMVTGRASTGLEVTFVWQDKDFSQLSTACTSTSTGLDRQACCPSAVSVAGKVGLRCANFTVIP